MYDQMRQHIEMAKDSILWDSDSMAFHIASTQQRACLQAFFLTETLSIMNLLQHATKSAYESFFKHMLAEGIFLHQVNLKHHYDDVP